MEKKLLSSLGKIKLKKNLTIKEKAMLALYLLIPIIGIILLILPADYFDTGQSMCVSVVLFDQECYACGMTRGIQHLIHFDFMDAWEFNWLSFIVLPLMIFVISSEFWKFWKTIRAEGND